MTQRVLVADDSAAMRRAIRARLLAHEDLEIVEAENGREAIALAKAFQPHLILLDLAMPELNGAEAATALKKSMPRVPIILCTVYADDIGPSLASAVGVDLVVSKPQGLSRLLEMVRLILDPPSAVA